jgi:hypothetical protein
MFSISKVIGYSWTVGIRFTARHHEAKSYDSRFPAEVEKLTLKLQVKFSEPYCLAKTYNFHLNLIHTYIHTSLLHSMDP